MAAKALAALPVLALAGWSGNAALVRMQRESQPLEFVTGSMDDTIMESLETGDLIFFTRKLSSLQPLAALHTLALRRQLDPRFDHCGWVYVDRLGRKFVVEETLGQVQCRPYSARILASEACEIAVLPLKAARSREMQDAAVAFVTRELARKSRVSLRQFVTALIDPAKLKKAAAGAGADDDAIIAFPAAAFVAEAYDAMGLVDKDKLSPTLSVRNVTPRDFVAKRKLQFRPEAGDAHFASLLPIRLE